LGYLARAGLSLEDLRKDAVAALDALKKLFLAMGQAYGAAAIDQRSRYGLPDPPGRVGGEAYLAFAVELFRRLDEPDIPLLDEIEKGHIGSNETAGNFDDEAKVRLYQMASRFFVSREDPAGELSFFFRGKEGNPFNGRVIVS
jgi:hypothetical protein